MTRQPDGSWTSAVAPLDALIWEVHVAKWSRPWRCALIEKHFDSIEEAASLLDALATEREREADGLDSAVIPTVVREELDGAFSKNAERMVTHASRELDRSLARYWKLKEQLEDAAPPSENHHDGPDEDGPAPAPTPTGPKGDDSPGALSRPEVVLDELQESTSDKQ